MAYKIPIPEDEKQAIPYLLESGYGKELQEQLSILESNKVITKDRVERILHIEARDFYKFSVKGNAWRCWGEFLKRFPELFNRIDLILSKVPAEKYYFVINSQMESEMDKILKYKNLSPTKHRKELSTGRNITIYIGLLENPRQFSLNEHPVRNAFSIAEDAGIRVGYYYYFYESDNSEELFYQFIPLCLIRSFPINKDEFGDFSSSAGGFRDDLQAGFKSAWEANIARILNEQGVKWEYENASKSYFTELGAYIPDFRVYRESGIEVIEVKGMWDNRSLKKVSAAISQSEPREEKIIVIDEDFYSLLEEKYKATIPHWEVTGRENSKKTFNLPVVGITVGVRKNNVKKLSVGDSLKLIRQPDNPYDKNAILVVSEKDEEIGFIAKDWASIFSFKMDHGFDYEASVKMIEEKVVTIKVKATNKTVTILKEIGF